MSEVVGGLLQERDDLLDFVKLFTEIVHYLVRRLKIFEVVMVQRTLTLM